METLKDFFEKIFAFLFVVYYFFNLAVWFTIYWFWAWIWCMIIPIAPFCYLVDKFM